MINIVKSLPYIKSMKISIDILSILYLRLHTVSLNVHFYDVIIVKTSQYVTDKSSVTFVQCLVGLFQVVLLFLFTVI